MRKMKNILSIVFFPMLMLFLQHCDEGQPEPKTELEKLPPATQEGKDTFGCLVNGKAWYTKSSTDATADYQLGSLEFGGTIYEPSQSIGISLSEHTGQPALGVGTYGLISTSIYDPWVSFFVSINCYYGGSSLDREDTVSGSLTITKFDKVNYIISGTFEFTIAHSGCQTFTITDGRFDMHYAP
jgi:hypothetical protein